VPRSHKEDTKLLETFEEADDRETPEDRDLDTPAPMPEIPPTIPTKRPKKKKEVKDLDEVLAQTEPKDPLENQKKYDQSIKGKSSKKRYALSQKGKDNQKRYSKTGKARSALRKYYNSEKGQEGVKTRAETIQEFKKIQIWLRTNPGKTVEDYLKENQSNE